MNEFKPLFDQFATAKGNGLKYPKIRLHSAEKDLNIILSQAGSKSKFPGSISICSPGGFGDNIFYGRISENSTIQWNKYDAPYSVQDAIKELLFAFIDNPAETAKLYGHATGHCCFCGTQITTDESLTVGYGPICAENFGLPWGLKTGANIQEFEFAIPTDEPKPQTKGEALIEISAFIAEWRNAGLTDDEAFHQIQKMIFEANSNG